MLILISGAISAQVNYIRKAQNQAQNLVQQTSLNSYSQDEAVSAIKEALNKGVIESVKEISKENGYFKDPEIKIPFPEEAKSMESKLNAMGMKKKVDEVVLSINRAAEDAATEAQDIFINAIREMTLADGMDIVKGNDDAATQYLKKHTSDKLKTQFKPIIKTSLDDANATKYWDVVVKTYNKIPMVKKMNPDLTDYVTEKAMEGLFIKVAEVEKEIRKNPVARTSDILKKVFGN